jgi:hypothetical protein
MNALIVAAYRTIPSGTVWLGWAYLTKKMPHAATTPIATAFKICIIIATEKMGF